MTKAYIIAHMTITNPEDLIIYAERVTPLLKKYGVVTLARGGRSEQHEGDSLGYRHVIHEFPSYEKAMEFYNCDEYREIRLIRMKSTISYVVVVEGL